MGLLTCPNGPQFLKRVSAEPAAEQGPVPRLIQTVALALRSLPSNWRSQKPLPQVTLIFQEILSIIVLLGFYLESCFWCPSGRISGGLYGLYSRSSLINSKLHILVLSGENVL